VRDATPQTKGQRIRAELPAQTIANIQDVLIKLEADDKAQRTINGYRKNLLILAKKTELNDPEATKLAIARWKNPNGQPASNTYKDKLVSSYQHYAKTHKIEWDKPVYHPDERGIQPPTTEQVKMLVSSAREPLSTKIQLMMETGCRPCEIQGDHGLRARDVHTAQKTITPESLKRCNARPALVISEELTAKLGEYITAHKLKPDDRLFTGQPERFSKHFMVHKNRIAERLRDSQIRNIRLYDLRHYYVTKQLKRTQNCEIVRQLVGHKHLNTTQRYMHLLASNQSGEWIVEGTTDKERAKQLLQEDFTYQLTTPDGTVIFRKPK